MGRNVGVQNLQIAASLVHHRSQERDCSSEPERVNEHEDESAPAIKPKLLQRQKLEAFGHFAGGVAHEFNNVLGVILGRSSMVQSRLGPRHSLWDDMEAIRLACREGAALTQQMVSFSRGAPDDVLTLELNATDAATEQFVPDESRPRLVAGTVRILLVEDRAELRDTIEQGLVGAGYQVIATGDPSMALALVEKGDLELDVLVTDVVMPKLGGRELAARVVALRPNVRAVFMSGYESKPAGFSREPPTREHRAELRKPFTIATLTHAIERVLGEA